MTRDTWIGVGVVALLVGLLSAVSTIATRLALDIIGTFPWPL